MKFSRIAFVMALIALANVTYAGLSGSGSTNYSLQAVCGNGLCEDGETNANCPQDCPISTCGNGDCDLGEDNTNCPTDCQVITCGNGVCDFDEDPTSCPNDCGGAGGAIEIDVSYEYARNGVIALIPTGGECTNPRGCPNFSKTMPIKFDASGTVRGLFTKKCGDTCTSSFTFGEDTNSQSMTWDPFFSVFAGDRVSNDLLCNQYYSLLVTMSSPEGDFGWTTEKVYLSCEEKITLNPGERRLAIGEKNAQAFLMNVWNPTTADKTYNIEIRPQADQSYVSSWLIYVCGSTPQCSVSSNIATVTVPAVSSREVQVLLTSEASSRAGTYPITFFDAGNNIQGKGTLLVSAEGLSEFQSWQIIVLVVLSLGIIAVIK